MPAISHPTLGAPRNLHVDTISQRIPQWLIDADDATRNAVRNANTTTLDWYNRARREMPDVVRHLADAHTEYRTCSEQVAQVFNLLPSPQDYAGPLLEAALEKRFNRRLDSRSTYLFHARHAVVDQSFQSASKDPMVQAQNAKKAATCTLLNAAMQNFEAWEATPGGMDNGRSRAGLFAHYPLDVLSIKGTPLGIAPHEFAALCRELDLGKQYQQRIDQVLQWPQKPGDAPGTGAAQVAAWVKLLERATFRLHVHMAYIKADIDEAMHGQLLAMNHESSYSTLSHVSLFDIPLNGIMVIEDSRRYSDGMQRVVAYVPGDPVGPLKLYESRLAFVHALRQRLIRPAYRAFFAGLVPARQRNKLFSRLQSALYPKVWNRTYRWYEIKLDSNADLHMTHQPFDTYWLQELYARKTRTLKDDALFHLVPTAVEDQKTREAKLQYFEDKLFDALNVAAFVVPGLGEVMLVVTAVQLGEAVYEGVDSLIKGDKDAAFGYLMGVVDNLAMLALMAAGGASLGSALPAVEVPEVVKSMRPVTLPDGTTRLWKPDLAPFHHDVLLPRSLTPNELGLYEYQGKQWLARDGRNYSVKATSDSSYRMQHPSRTNAYEPVLRHNGKGAWLHELDQPQQWQNGELIRHLGPIGEGVDDDMASRLLRISDTPEAALRYSLDQGEAPPALLEDTLQRFGIERELKTFFADLATAPQQADVVLQLQLLSEQPGWPAQRALRLIDEQGRPLRTFASTPTTNATQTIDVAADDSSVLSSVLGQLDEPQAKALLNEEFGAGRVNLQHRTQALRQQLLAYGKRHQGRLFQIRYLALQDSRQTLSQVIKARYGDLPTPVVEELLAHASTAENDLMRQGQLPQRIADEAQAYQENTRLARAYEGLYLDHSANPDAEKIKLHSIQALPGWSPQVQIQVREGYFHGRLVDQVGTDEASIRKVLIRQGDRYQARDAQEGELQGDDDVYGSVLHALPDAQRAQLGFPGVAHKPALMQAVRDAPLLPRRKVKELLNLADDEPGARSPMRLARGRQGMPLDTSDLPAGSVTEDSLLDKLRILDMELALQAHAQDILAELYAAGLDRAAIDARLNTLLDEEQQLRSVLDVWVMESSAISPMSDARMYSRQGIGDALWHHWRCNGLTETGRAPTALRLESVYLSDFPERLPSFVLERVRNLELRDFRLNTENPVPLGQMAANALAEATSAEETTVRRFFNRLPNVTRLSMEGDEFMNFSWFRQWTSMISECFPALAELRLVDMRLSFHEVHMAHFRQLRQLRRLDLSGNRFYSLVDLSGLELDYLGMDRTVDQWSTFRPNWFDMPVLDCTREMSLRGNHIDNVPAPVLANPINAPRTTRIVITDNPLPRSVLFIARLSERPGSRFAFDAGLPEDMVRTLIEERSELEQTLADWQASSSSSSTTNQASTARQLTRQRTAQAITEYWRSYRADGTEGLPAFLKLEGAAIADFPGTLPERFYTSTEHLLVTYTDATTAQLNQFLRRFPNVRNLAFTHHVQPMTELPSALLELSQLHSLGLSDQGLVIDQNAIDFFARMPVLETLILNDNTLGTVADASALTNRSRAWLSLDNTGITQWPEWVNALIPEYLERLGLENNRLTELPDHIVANRRSDSGYTMLELRGNPLTHDTIRSVFNSEAYHRPYAFEVDLPEDIGSLPASHPHDSDSDMSSTSSHSVHSPGLYDEANAQVASVEPWLQGDVEAEPHRRARWDTLVGAGDASELLNIIDRLRQTADYRRLGTRTELISRVWAVLDAASSDASLRILLNGMAEEPMQQFIDHATCPDGIRLAFNQMEVQVFTGQALRDISAADRGQSLHRLLLRLYRLDALDGLARREAGARDAAEVRLAYRLRLARELDLPVPPGRMLYEGTADLRPAELQQAQTQIAQGESGQALLDYATGQEFWTQYLRETYADRFEALKSAYRAQVLEVSERYADESLDQLGVRIKALDARLKEGEQALLKELTNQEHNRYL